MCFVKSVDRKMISEKWKSISFVNSKFELTSALGIVYIYKLFFQFVSQV